MLELSEILLDGVGNVDLVERFGANAVEPDYPCGNAYGGCVRRHFVENHRSGGDSGIVPYGEGSQHLCAGTDQDIVAESRMTFAGVPLENRSVLS